MHAFRSFHFRHEPDIVRRPDRLHKLRTLVGTLMAAAVLAALLATPAVAQADQVAEPDAVSPADSGCDPDFVGRHGSVWTVHPNGTDDTASVECAIGRASEAYGTPTVRLARGTFHLDFLSAEGFTGLLRGAGRAHTTIEPLEGGLDCVSAFEQFGTVAWITLLDSDPIIRDLSLSIPDVACVEPWREDLTTDPDSGEVSGLVNQDFDAMVMVATRSLEPTDSCGVTGRAGLFASRMNISAPRPDFSTPILLVQGAFSALFVVGTQPVNCDVADDASGDVSVRGVHTDGVGNLIHARAIVDSDIRVLRNHVVGADASVILVANEGTSARVQDNRLEDTNTWGIISDNCFGLEAAQCQQGSSKVNISHNHIDMSGNGQAAIAAFDGRATAPQIDTRIWRNQISGDGNFTGVGLVSVNEGRVALNTFDGASVFAVAAFGVTTNSRIVNNDMTGHTAFEASILLEDQTAENRVIRNAGATVIDLGTDNTVDADPPVPVSNARVATSDTADELHFDRTYTSYRSYR